MLVPSDAEIASPLESVPPEKLPAIIDVLTKQLQQFQKKIEDQIKAASSSASEHPL